MRLTRDKALSLLGFWRAFRSDELSRINIENVEILPGKGMSELDKILGDDCDNLLNRCDEYLAYASKNYLPFILPLYKNQRTFLFRAVKLICPESATEDRDILTALEFIQKNKHKRDE